MTKKMTRKMTRKMTSQKTQKTQKLQRPSGDINIDDPPFRHCDDYIDDPTAPAVLRKYLEFARAPAALSIYGDEPGILVQRSRIDVQLRGTCTFIRDASRAEVAP